jgi:hypothetical protein
VASRGVEPLEVTDGALTLAAAVGAHQEAAPLARGQVTTNAAASAHGEPGDAIGGMHVRTGSIPDAKRKRTAVPSTAAIAGNNRSTGGNARYPLPLSIVN